MDQIDCSKYDDEAGSGDGSVQSAAVIFCRNLKSLREARGLSIAAVAQATRIRPNLLEALEAGRFKELPGAVFARGFVRALAKIYETDGVSLCTAFDLALSDQVSSASSSIETPSSAQQPMPSARVSNLGSKDETRRAFEAMVPSPDSHAARHHGAHGGAGNLYRTMGGLAVAGLAIVGIRFLIEHGSIANIMPATAPVASVRPDPKAFRQQKNKSRVEPVHSVTSAPIVPAELPAEPHALADAETEAGVAIVSEPADGRANAPKPAIVAAPAPAKAVESSAPTVPAAPVSPSPNKVPEATATVAAVEPAPKKIEPASVAPMGEQSLDLVVLSPVRVKVDLDAGGGAVQELKPDTYHLTFSESANLLIYDAAALTISYNGNPLGELGAKGRVRRLSFRARKSNDPASL